MRAELWTQTGSWLLTYLLHSTLLLGGTWLVSRRVVQSPALREILWKAALVGGLITASLQAGLGFEPLGGAVSLSFDSPAAAPAPGHEDRAARSWNGVLVPGPGSLAEPTVARQPAEAAPSALLPVSQPAIEAAPAERTSAGSAAGFRILPLLLSIWASGAALLFGLYLVQRVRAMRRIGSRQLVRDDRLLAMLDALRCEGRIRRPIRLTAAPGLSSPVALGSAEIALPEAALTELDGEQQRSMLAHELAHLARRDPSWLTLACVIERVLFFQPLNRLARHGMQEAAELLCDDWAVRRTGSGLSLATCLVKVAEWVDTTPRPVPLAGMAEHRSQLVTRIHRLIEGRTMSTSPRSLWLLAGAALLLGVTAVAAPGVAPAGPAGPDDLDLTTTTEGGDQAEADTPFTLGVEQADTDTVVADAPVAASSSTLSRLTREMRAMERRLVSTRARADARRALIEAQAAGLTRAVRPPTAPAPAIAPMALVAPRALVAALGGSRQRDTTSIAVPALIQALKDPDVEVRRAAVNSLSNLQDPRAVPGLIEALRDSDAEVRAGAANALGNLEDRRAVPGLVAAMKDSNRDVRQAALSALHSMPSGEVPDEAILSAINDNDGDVRREAIGLAISRLSDRSEEENAKPDARYVAAFTRLLADPSADVRREAANALGEVNLTEAPPALLAAARDKNGDVRQAVASSLGNIRDPRSVPALKELLQDPSGDVRECAVNALSNIRDHAALEALVAALKSSDATVRRAAAEALGQRED